MLLTSHLALCPQELCREYSPMHELSLLTEPRKISAGELWQLPPPKVGGRWHGLLHLLSSMQQRPCTHALFNSS